MDSKPPAYALLCCGLFADGKGTACFQIITSHDGGETWRLEEHADRLPNDPRDEATARTRLARWRT